MPHSRREHARSEGASAPQPEWLWATREQQELHAGLLRIAEHPVTLKPLWSLLWLQLLQLERAQGQGAEALGEDPCVLHSRSRLL